MLRFTQFVGYKIFKKQKTATLFLPFEYFIALSISTSGRNEPELSMRDRLRKRSHHWLGIDRVTPANRARNTAIVVKSGKKVILNQSRIHSNWTSDRVGMKVCSDYLL